MMTCLLVARPYLAVDMSRFLQMLVVCDVLTGKYEPRREKISARV